MGYCINCGEKIADGAKFCGSCGTPVEGKTVSNTEEVMSTENASDWAGKETFSWPNEQPSAGVTEPDAYSSTTQAPVASPAQTSEYSSANEVPINSRRATAGNTENNKKKNGAWMGILALVLAIISFFTYWAVSVVTAIAAITLAVLALVKKKRLKGFAIAALIITALSIWGLIEDYSALAKAKKADPSNGKSVVEQKLDEEETKEEIKKEKQGKQEEQEKSEISKKQEKQDKNEAQDLPSEDIDDDKADVAAGVDPDLKEFLDSYEAFVDEYCDFMVKYTNNPTDLGLLADYASIMGKYEEFAKAVDSYDSDKMSTADSIYYLEVVNRCNQKMVSALGAMGD